MGLVDWLAPLGSIKMHLLQEVICQLYKSLDS
jgi:hypothetical protein